MARGVWALIVLAGGCASFSPVSAPPDSVVVSPPAADGTRYVAVHGAASAASLGRRWRREARRSCDGEAVLITDQPGSTRRQGAVARRLHEGYVRCAPDG